MRSPSRPMANTSSRPRTIRPRVCGTWPRVRNSDAFTVSPKWGSTPSSRPMANRRSSPRKGMSSACSMWRPARNWPSWKATRRKSTRSPPRPTVVSSSREVGLRKQLRIWDLKESRQIGLIKLGTNPYLGTFSPDGRQVYWGCSDGTIRQIALPESVLNRDHPPGAGTGDNGASATTAPKPR